MIEKYSIGILLTGTVPNCSSFVNTQLYIFYSLTTFYKTLKYANVKLEMKIIGIILTAIGIWLLFSPKSFFNFEKKEVKLFGVKLLGTSKTFRVYRNVGVGVIAAGLLLIFFF